MISDALTWLKKFYKEAAKPEHLALPNVHNKAVVCINGDLKEFEHQAPPRKHSVETLDDLAKWTNSGGIPEKQGTSVTWFNIRGVVVVLDDDRLRMSVVQFTLTDHPKFAVFNSLDQWLAQADLLYFIRSMLRREIKENSPNFEHNLRQVKIRSGSTLNANVQHGNESFGKEIENAVSGAGELPEEIVVSVPRWVELPEIKVTVMLGFHVDPAQGRFRLAPLAGEIEAADQFALHSLRQELVEAGVQGELYCGTP